MDILSIILIGIGLAMDAFSVSVTDGIVLKKPSFPQAAKIALFFGAFQFIMPCIGYLLGSAFASYIQASDHWIAFILLAFIGGKMLFEAIRGNDDGEEIKNPLSFSTLLVLAVATSIDALAVGVTFATVNAPLLFASSIIGTVTFVISLAGVFLGSRFGNLFGNKAEIAGGLVLIGIGIKIFAEHVFFA
ncbi:MAG: manganese efflux pump MntP family protein [Clostridiales bacterium]|nr:manganese efflux pump MntP family protein [Clostridiales bacterium]